MKLDIDTAPFKIDGSRRFHIADAPTKIDRPYKDKKDYCASVEPGCDSQLGHV